MTRGLRGGDLQLPGKMAASRLSQDDRTRLATSGSREIKGPGSESQRQRPGVTLLPRGPRGWRNPGDLLVQGRASRSPAAGNHPRGFLLSLPSS